MVMDELKERLSDIEHDRWADWVRHMFSHCGKTSEGHIVIPTDLAEKWIRQMNTKYKDLPENEKEGDRREADRTINLLKDFFKDKP